MIWLSRLTDINHKTNLEVGASLSKSKFLSFCQLNVSKKISKNTFFLFWWQSSLILTLISPKYMRLSCLNVPYLRANLITYSELVSDIYPSLMLEQLFISRSLDGVELSTKERILCLAEPDWKRYLKSQIWYELSIMFHFSLTQL